MESTLVPVLLEESLLALWFIRSEFIGMFQVLLQPLFLREGASPFDLLSLLFTPDLLLFLLLDSRELSQTPRLEL